ncbi:MAG TPA: hypothetical protein VEK08_15275 [Planctomycetota bacterium]|nr:hypothetical protein [Planctomycetota bacterium]
MKQRLALAIVLCAFVAPLCAGEKVLTTNDRIALWVKNFAKEFKKVKFKEAYVLFPDFADRAFDSLEASGLQTNSNVFPTLSAELQNTLTRLKTNIDTTRDKRSAVKSTIDDLARDLRLAANSATPPPLNVASDLILLCYAAVNDGEVDQRERDQLNALAAQVTATPSLDAKIVADINTHLAAVTSSVGVRKTDLDTIAADLKTILELVK